METLNALRQEYNDLTDQINRAQKEYNIGNAQYVRYPHVFKSPPEHIKWLFSQRRTVNQILSKYYALEVGNAKSFLSWK